jgi:hypothetical protein
MRSILTFKIYSIVTGADIAFTISFILKIITKQFNMPAVPIIIYTDLYSLYKYLVKLNITKEKRLIINTMAIWQLYERRGLFKIQRINRLDNPVDTITKATLNKALENFINTNQIQVQVKGWVKRELGEA